MAGKRMTGAQSIGALILLAALGAGVAAHPARAQTAAPSGDAKLGARLFLQCRACHTINPGGANGVGPNLAGVMGAKAAYQKGYRYSPALAGSALKWTPATMDAWLKRPSALVPGNKMIFAGVADPKMRAHLIAYLATLKGK